ncbi:hypothetical protein ACHAQA_005792 [Verticillium albo-atrum]
MAETPATAARVSAAAPEKSARPSSGSTPLKLRSCVVCRSRKVRCDKQSPCSNCRRANIPCTVASDDRPPRWARRLERLTAKPPSKDTGLAADPATGQVMDRLRSLEKMVKELGDQLEQANGATRGSSANSPSGPMSHGSFDEQDHRMHASSASPASVQPNTGRLVGQEGGRSQYIGSNFWSRLDALKADTQGLAGGDSDMSDDETESPGLTTTTRESERGASERNGVLFGHNLGPSAPDLGQFKPLPSQIPFLVDVFAENVNFCLQVVHMPTLRNIVREMRSNSSVKVSASDEALVFAVYYAAVTSMSEEDVAASFGATKTELNHKFRLGLEYALAKADFIRLPDVTLIQAFIVFLCLARRYDSPRYVWMMTGLVARMAVAVGLHRDGAHFAHLSPFEAEIRRRVWWSLLLLDIRAAEDQGTEFSIANGSFDTKMPLNLNDADLDPAMTALPVERELDTDASFAVGSYRTCRVTREIMAARTSSGAADVAEQNRLLEVFRADVDAWGFSQHVTNTSTKAYWVGITVTHLVVSKLALFIHLPALLAPAGAHVPDHTRNSVLVAAIEVAEFNHALCAEPASAQWRWIIETYTHWHAIAFLLIETSRRAWSPVVERAWIALHSRWLIPPQPRGGDKSLRVWIPLRRLMGRARRHREAELRRLRGDADAAVLLRMQDSNVPVPISTGPFKTGDSVELFTKHWCDLVAGDVGAGHTGFTASADEKGSAESEQFDAFAGQVGTSVQGHASLQPGVDPSAYVMPEDNAMHGQSFPSDGQTGLESDFAFPADWSRDGTGGWGGTPGAWNATDAVDHFGAGDMDVNGDELNWKEWLESAAAMELDNL